MIKTFVHVLVGINDCTLLVYYTDARCWQFRVISNGSVYGECRIYYTAEAATDVGREWIVGR